jgi:hypothetical protein
MNLNTLKRANDVIHQVEDSNAGIIFAKDNKTGKVEIILCVAIPDGSIPVGRIFNEDEKPFEMYTPLTESEVQEAEAELMKKIEASYLE